MKIFSRISSLLKSHFLSGLFVVIPLGVIAWISVGFLGMLWQIRTLVPESLRPENYIPNEALVDLLNLAMTLGVAILLALWISFLGWGSKKFMGRRVLQWLGEVIERIPVIRSIYSALDQLLRTIASGGGRQFSRVVYVEYPRKGVWTLAFVTGPAKGFAPDQNYLNLYVPTTPNPTSGFHLIVAESEVRESHLKVEDAFKTILSLGIAQSSTSDSSRGGG